VRLLAISDLHGILPEITQHGDVLVIAGDIVPATRYYHGNMPAQAAWIKDTFVPWLRTVPVSHIVMTWGNHDWVADQSVPLLDDSIWPDNVHVLVNRGVTIDGVHFYGVPQTPRFYDWAFNEDDTDNALGKRWAAVDEGTGVLVSHGPPRGACDWLINRTHGERAGSNTQEAWLKSDAINHPKIVICGHLHAAGGSTSHCGDSVVYNVAIADDGYRQVRGVKEILV